MAASSGILATHEVKGYLNSPASIQGVQAYVDMFKYGPEGSETWDWDAVNSAFQQGHLAMAMQWYYFDGSNSDPKVNPYAEKTGYGVTPGQVGLDGKFRREMMIGGQGIGLTSIPRSSPRRSNSSEWFYHPEQQKRWAAVCQTGLKSVLDSPEWQKVNTYNKSFANAMTHMHHDYWHLPEYPQLLDILQDEVTAASSGKKSVKEALNSAAERQEQLLEEAGYKITRTAKIPDVPNAIVNPVGTDKSFANNTTEQRLPRSGAAHGRARSFCLPRKRPDMKWNPLLVPGVIVGAYLLLSDGPVFWLALSSIKSRQDLFTLPPKLFFHPVWTGYEAVFGIGAASTTAIAVGLYSSLVTSILVSVLGTFFAVVLGTLAGMRRRASALSATGISVLRLVDPHDSPRRRAGVLSRHVFEAGPDRHKVRSRLGDHVHQSRPRDLDHEGVL